MVPFDTARAWHGLLNQRRNQMPSAMQSCVENAPGFIELQAHLLTYLECSRLIEIMDHFPIPINDLEDNHVLDLPTIAFLPTALGMENGLFGRNPVAVIVDPDSNDSRHSLNRIT